MTSRSLGLIMLGLMLFVCSDLASARCCQCTANDGSCSASICCAGGCLAVCAPQDNCVSECASLLTVKDAAGLDRTVTVKGEDIPGLAKALAQETGLAIAVQAWPGTEALQINANDFPARRLLEVLSGYADITINGRSFHPANEKLGALALDELVSLEFLDSDQAAISKALTRVLHAPVEFVAAEDGMTLNMDLQDVTLRQALKALARVGTIRVSGQPYRPE